MLTEEEVYNGAKRWLNKNGYIVVAGQPARGVDHLPVIEIKNPTGDKGSKYSYKPDLIAYRLEDNAFCIVECKPEYNEGDYEKIVSVLSSKERKTAFYNELSQYRIFNKVNYTNGFEYFDSTLFGMLSFSGDAGPTKNIPKLIVSSWKGNATLIEPNN